MCFLQVELLAHRWRYPTVSIHGIEGAFSDPGTKTVIPAKVTAKFSIRQVPDMEPATVQKQVPEHVLMLVFVSASALSPLLWCVHAVGHRPPALSVCQEEESKQAEGFHGDWSQALVG